MWLFPVFAAPLKRSPHVANLLDGIHCLLCVFLILPRGFLVTQSTKKGRWTKGVAINPESPCSLEPLDVNERPLLLFKVCKDSVTSVQWVFHSLMHDKKKNCFNNSTSSGFSHLVWDLGDWLCGIRGLMFVYLCWKSGSDWPTVKYQQPLHDCVLCSALSSGPLVCSSPTLNMSAACELMGKPCLWWLSAATGGNVVMLERPWCGPQHSVSTLTQTEVRGFEMFMLDIPLCSRRSVS